MTAYVNTAEGVANNVTSFTNSANQERVMECAQALANQHRTLQAYNVNLVMQFLGVMANQSTDARNEYAVKAAKAGYAAMVEALNGATRVPSC